MGRNHETKCRYCRREGMKLFLKGERCHTDKCPITKRKFIRNKRGKISEYGKQLREKQKIKRYYGLRERQFRINFEKASKMAGITGENMLILLEKRLDNVIYRLKLAKSRAQARQFVTHRMFKVNGKIVNIPSYLVKKGDEIELSSHGLKNKTLNDLVQMNEGENPEVEWLSFDYQNKKGKVEREPQRNDITMSFNEQLVVEFYSK